jgi:hypothetical protein
MKPWATAFRIEDEWSDLERNSTTCGFCSLRWDLSKHVDRKKFPERVTFERVKSKLRISDSNSPALSIFQSAG